MSMLRRALAVTAAVGAMTIAAALPAHANSLSDSIQAGTYSYDDAQDRFCAKSGGTYKSITVTLTPSSSSRGPKKEFTVKNGASQCVSLATAYEDTKYTAQLLGFDSNGGCGRCGERSGANFTFFS